jgi:DNA primase
MWNFDNGLPVGLFFGKDGNAYLIITEGFKACLWLLQCGYTNTVALMGSSLSEKQASLLHRLRVRVVLFLDNDTREKEAMKKIGKLTCGSNNRGFT